MCGVEVGGGGGGGVPGVPLSISGFCSNAWSVSWKVSVFSDYPLEASGGWTSRVEGVQEVTRASTDHRHRRGSERSSHHQHPLPSACQWGGA